MIKLLRSLFYGFWLTLLLASVAESRLRCEALFLEDPNSHFETNVMNSWPHVKRLRVAADKIISIEKRIATGGAYASGILRVQTEEGFFALKVFTEGYLAKRLAPTFIIQNALANLGMAPRIHAVFTSKEVQVLKEKFPEIDSLVMGDEVSIAVMMDEVPVVSHMNNSGYDFIPKTWDKTRLEKRITEIEEAMSNLRVPPPEDLQLVFDSNDRLILLDFDRYTYFSKNLSVFGEFSPDGEMSVNEYIPLVSNLRYKPEYQFSNDGRFKVRFHRLRKILGLSESQQEQ